MTLMWPRGSSPHARHWIASHRGVHVIITPIERYKASEASVRLLHLISPACQWPPVSPTKYRQLFSMAARELKQFSREDVAQVGELLSIVSGTWD